jgi:hypothetical protein
VKDTLDKLSKSDIRQLVIFARILASYAVVENQGVKGVDVTTGRRDGSQSSSCDAQEWLDEHNLVARVKKP